MKSRNAHVACGLVLVMAATQTLAGPRTAQAQPRRKGDCSWVHGRFIVYTGDGRFVIWIVGTKRTVEVVDDTDDVSGIFQAYEKRVPLKGDIDPLFADFRVCALKNSKPGHMQPVRVSDVRNATLGGMPFRFHPTP